MPLILHIDTSNNWLYLALSSNGVLVNETVVNETNNHVALINIEIENLLKKNSNSLHNLNAIAVLNGPGSYTGLRVGLSLAKAFCFVLNIPLLLSNKLELMAMCSEDKEPVFTIIKAMKNEYFVALYQDNVSVVQPCLVKINDLPRLKLNKHITILIDESIKTELSINRYEIAENKSIYKAFLQKSYSQFAKNESVDLTNAIPFYIKNTYIAQSL